MSLPPIVYHVFSRPLPYVPTLTLQQQIHQLQLQRRRALPGSHQDVLLLLEHRPVYTAGRRQTELEFHDEAERLRHLGADFVFTKRGGQTTYHGPGQVVGYPLFDLARMSLSVADYICKIQAMLKLHLLHNYSISSIDSDSTGVFSAPDVKIASIGVQVRHRLTTHGFAYNFTSEPSLWFNKIVACGLAHIRAGCIAESGGLKIPIAEDIQLLIPLVSKAFQRDIIKLDTTQAGPLEQLINHLEAEGIQSGPWLCVPKSI